jgi:hypothetical protein
MAALDGLCLDCVAPILDTHYGTVPEIGDVFFTDKLRYIWRRFYRNFYSQDEQAELSLWETEDERSRRLHQNMQRIVPWLSKRGVQRTCPHAAGKCRDLNCCRGTKALPSMQQHEAIVAEPEVDMRPAGDEETKPSAARLVVGKRRTKKGKQEKGLATTAPK